MNSIWFITSTYEFNFCRWPQTNHTGQGVFKIYFHRVTVTTNDQAKNVSKIFCSMISDDIVVRLWECQDKVSDWQQQYCNYHWCNLGTLESWQSWWWWDTVTWSQKITLHPVLRASISNIIKFLTKVDTAKKQRSSWYIPIQIRDCRQRLKLMINFLLIKILILIAL